MTKRRNSQGAVFLFLAALATFIVAGALVFAFSAPPAGPPMTEQTQQLAKDAVFLAESKAPSGPQSIPPWLILLVAAFALVQVFSLLLASRLARDEAPTPRVIATIAFLCDTPMYLGLLGSLLGICLTQWVTGSLAAPLAYLTSISGIVLHLFGKFAIVLTLPQLHLAEQGILEE